MANFQTNYNPHLILNSKDTEGNICDKTILIDFSNGYQENIENGNSNDHTIKQAVYMFTSEHNKHANGTTATNLSTQVEEIEESQVVVDEEYFDEMECDDLTDFCENCGEAVSIILAHLMENPSCLLKYRNQKYSESMISKELADQMTNTPNGELQNELDDSGISNALQVMENQMEDISKRLDRCERLANLKNKSNDNITSSDNEMPEYLDEDTMKYIRMKNIRPVTEKVCLRKNNTEAPRRNYIKKERCKHCSVDCKYILSHLSKSFRCQVDYDMTKLRLDAIENKRLRQKFYERNHTATDSDHPPKRKKHSQNRSDHVRPIFETKVQRRAYSNEYRRRQKSKQMRLELQQYQREMTERNLDLLTSEEVIRVTHDIMQSSIGETPSIDIVKNLDKMNSGDQMMVTKFKHPKKIIKLTRSRKHGKEDDFANIEVVDGHFSEDEETPTFHIECNDSI